MFIPQELWQYLAQTSDALGVVGFLSALVRYVAEKRAAQQEATIDDYLKLVRRGEHKEICELVRNDEQALDALRTFTANIVAQSTDRIINEIRAQSEELKRLAAKLDQISEHLTAPVPRRPELEVKVTRPLERYTSYSNGTAAYRLGIVVTNRSRSVATITRGRAVLAWDRDPFVAKDGELNSGYKLGPDNDTTPELIASTGQVNLGGSELRLVSIVLEIAQDDEGFRCMIPRERGSKIELVDMRDDVHVGQKWMTKPRDARPNKKVTLHYPTDDLKGWVTSDNTGNELELRAEDLVETGMAPLSEE